MATSARRSAGHGSAGAGAESAPDKAVVKVGNFRRLESIGKGSFAIVYKAVHPTGSLVAIKTVQHSQLKGKLKANLLSEIDILKRIHHPHIVALISVLESTNHIHLVMEFCQLGDLATFVRKRDKLAAHPVTADMMRSYPNPPGAGFHEVIVRHFAKQLSSAMEFLRGKNLVHRDLKPQNLLLNPPAAFILTQQPQDRPFEVAKQSLIPLAGIASMPVLKIADFGFARHLPQTTMAETLCGSPLYMAPEILRYEKYDNKADLWSVGAVLYELATGRPPFRAANHVELLRRIEKANDQISFPAETAISRALHDVICGLLKKMPTERMGWEGFFSSALIKDEIPGLVAADLPAVEAGEAQKDDEAPAQNDMARDEPPSPKASPRPRLTSHATEPLPKRTGSGTGADLAAVPMEKRLSQDAHADSPSSTDRDRDRKRLVARQAHDRRVRDDRDREREKAAQDVAFERDYVMVERRAVEINALADEMAASPRLASHGPRASPSAAGAVGAVVRRATTHALPTLGSPASPSARFAQLAGHSPPGTSDAAHQRRMSYERSAHLERKVSTNSAITAALQNVQFRMPFLFSPTASPAQGTQGYGPYPAFAAAMPAGPLLLQDGSAAGKQPPALAQDQKIVAAIEERATRSDTVFSFAEVKFKQLVPMAPSSSDAGPRGLFRAFSSPAAAAGSDDAASAGADDDDLTPDAVLAIAEEALVLYIKTLAILTNTIRLAGNWWAAQRARDRDARDARIHIAGEPASAPSAYSRSAETALPGVAAGADRSEARINLVVQWARNRFNECLEKSEYASRRSADAQRRLERRADRPPSRSASGASDSSDSHLPSAVSAEKLMYDRALDMSKTAAVNELVGDDLPGCEVAYATAVRLLEAVLEGDDDGRRRDDEIEEADRRTVQKRGYLSITDTDRPVIDSMRLRLATLRRKVELQRLARRPSVPGGPPTSPGPAHAQPAVMQRAPSHGSGPLPGSRPGSAPKHDAPVAPPPARPA